MVVEGYEGITIMSIFYILNLMRTLLQICAIYVFDDILKCLNFIYLFDTPSLKWFKFIHK
jgi:hypothetical protein